MADDWNSDIDRENNPYNNPSGYTNEAGDPNGQPDNWDPFDWQNYYDAYDIERAPEDNPNNEEYWDKPGRVDNYIQNYTDVGQYWNPQNIARYDAYAQAQPEDWIAPDWYQGIVEAKNQLQAANPGKTPDQWQMTPEVTQLVSGMKTPPVEAVPDYEKSKTTWSAVDEQMKSQGFQTFSAAEVPDEVKAQYIDKQPPTELGGDKFYLPDGLAANGMPVMQPGEYKPPVIANTLPVLPGAEFANFIVNEAGSYVGGVPAEQYNQLEWWKKALLPIFNGLPYGMGMVGGATMGAVAGPGGAIIGAGAGAVATYYGSQVNEDGSPKYPGWFQAMQAFNVGGQTVENVAGTGARLSASIFNPVKFGPVEEVLGQLPELYQSGRVFYEGLFPEYKDGKLVSQQLTTPGEIVSEFGTEKAIGTQLDRPLEGVRTVGLMDFSGMDQMREQLIRSNANEADANNSFLQNIWEKLTYSGYDENTALSIYYQAADRYGFRGQAQDMLAQMVADPLNVMGTKANKAGSKIAEKTGKNTLSQALGNTEGPAAAVREYGRIVRQELTADQRAALNPVAKWASGLDKLGNMKEYTAAPDKVGFGKNLQNPIDYMLGLDRKSRATQVLNNAMDGLTQSIWVYAQDNPEMAVKLIDQIANLTPQNTLDALGKYELPRWFDSAEAQHIPAALKDQVTKVHELYDQYKMFDSDRQVLTKVAEAVGEDVYKLVNEMHNADADGVNGAENVYRRFIDKVADKAAQEAGIDPAQLRDQLRIAKTPQDAIKAIPEGQAGNLLKALLSDATTNRLTGKKLKLLAKKFAGENPVGIGLTTQDFNARLMYTLENGIGNWSAKYFGVKPSSLPMRMAQLVKKATGIALLGQNPGNFVNNTINNMVTLAWDNLLGSTFENRKAWMETSGIKSSRFGDSGLVSGETGMTKNPITEATRVDGKRGGVRGWLDKKTQSLTDAAQKASQNKVIAPFGAASRKSEQWAHEIAFVTGAKEFVTRAWTAGKGFDKITPDLRKAMDTVQPGLADAIEKAIARADNIKDIENVLNTGLNSKGIKDVLTTDEISDLSKFNQEGFDGLDKSIREARTLEEVWSAVDKFSDDAVTKLNDISENDTFNTMNTAMLKVSVEGMKGVADIIQNINQDFAEFHHQHIDNMAELAENAKGLTWEQHSAVYRKGMREANQSWDLYNANFDKKWIGALKGLGDIDPQESKAMNLLGDLRDNNNYFFNRREELWTDFDLNSKSMTDAERTAAIAEINKQLNTEYIDYIMERERLQFEFDKEVADLYVKKATAGIDDPLRLSNTAAEIALWLGKRQEVSRKQAMQEVLFRQGEIPRQMLAEFGDIIPDQVKQDILSHRAGGDKESYYKNIYKPTISEMLDTSNRYAPGREAFTPEKTAELQPIIKTQSLAKQRSEVRKLFHDNVNINNDNYIVNSFNKYMETNVQSLNEITPEMVGEYLAKREAAYANPMPSVNRANYQQLLRDTMNLTDAEMKQLFIAQDAFAKYWAEQNNTTADAFYERAYKEISKGEGQGLQQTDIQSPAFKKWFGDSKVVDEQGKPLVVYHGTGDAGFTEFDRNKSGRMDYGFLGIGNYFSSRKNIASDYSIMAPGDSKAVYPVYLNIEKPYIWKNKGYGIEGIFGGTGNKLPDDLHEAVLKRSGLSQEDIDTYPVPSFMKKEVAKAVTDELKARRYDGVISPFEDGTIEINAFKPEQIKSVNNRGTFDPTDPNIMRQAAKGSVSFLENGQAVIKGMQSADISTAIHEPGHVWLRMAPDQDKAIVTKWLKDTTGIELEADWMMRDYTGNAELVNAHETFARALERYFREGIAPQGASKKLINAFNQIKEFMTRVYKEITGSQIDVEINPELRAMLDTWMTGKRVEPDPVVQVKERADAILGRASEPAWIAEITPDAPKPVDAEILDKVIPYHRNNIRNWFVEPSNWDNKARITYRQLIDKVIRDRATRIRKTNVLVDGTRPFGETIPKYSVYLEEKKGWTKLIDLPDDVGKYYEDLIAKPTPIEPNAKVPPEVHDQVVAERAKALGGEDLFQSEITGKKYSSIKTPDVTGDGRGSPSATLGTTTESHRNKGAGVDLNIAESKHDDKSLFQENKWTPETLHNWFDIILANNDKFFLLDAVRQERGGQARIDFIDKFYHYKPDPARSNPKALLADPVALAEVVGKAMRHGNEFELDVTRWNSRTVDKLKELEPRKKIVETLKQLEPGERLPEDQVPLGTVDSLTDMPKSDIMREGYINTIKPMLNKIRNMDFTQASKPIFDLNNLPDDVKAGLEQYKSKVRQQRADVNMGAIRYGEGRADQALLNYNRQTQADAMANLIMPYQFWYTRSMLNWALRAIDKPSIFANYFRLMNFSNSQTERDGFPTRLKGKLGFHVPFLPQGFQDIYIDPMRQIFPFTQMAKPWIDNATAANRENQRAKSILQDAVENGDIDQNTADQALQTMQGEEWDKALAQARNELDSDSSNLWDFSQTVSGWNLPLGLSYNYATGRMDRQGLLPATRLIKTITAASGVNDYKGLDLAKTLTPGLGKDTYEDYRINQMLANMVAQGEISEKEAKDAMVSKQGAAYKAASQKVAYVNMGKQIFASIGLDVYPEGEQKNRAANEAYKNEAIPAYEAGDTKAKSNFFDANPGLSARYQSFNTDPDQMLNKYLVSEVWDTYNALPDLYKQQARDQLGAVFTDWMNPDTRGTMSDSTLAGWAKAMNGQLPKDIEAANTPIKFASKEAASAVQNYYDARNKKFPWYSEATKIVYDLPENDPRRQAFFKAPEYQAYSKWSNEYKANNKSIIPWLTKEDDELYGVDPDISAKVYQYKADKENNFPTNEYDAYKSLPEQAKKAFEKTHPNVTRFSEWSNQYLANNPEIIPYVLGKDNPLSRATPEIQQYVYQYKAAKDRMFPGIDENWEKIPWATRNKYTAWQKEIAGQYPDAATYILSDNAIRKSLGQPTVKYNPIKTSDMSPELKGHYMDFLYSKQPLTVGANMELRRLWEEAGRPEGDYKSYLNSLK